MIKEMKLIPVTENSHPFITAVNACELESYGFVEEEFFQTGTANIYEEDAEGRLSVAIPDAPYTTRLIIRRPEKPEAFSGNVIIEVLNSSANYDIDRDWMLLWRKIVRDGDIYIGITSKGHAVDALKRFDPERYAPINWADPAPERPAPAEAGFDYLPGYELGLFWDMLIDLAKILRKDDPLNPLKAFGKNWLYLTGWSQSGSYLARMAHTFAYLPENCAEGPLFDGWLNTGSSATDKTLNSRQLSEPMHFSGRPKGASLLVTKEPFIAVNTESENRHTFWYGDFDEPECKFRTWQIPCSSHDTKYTLLDYYRPMMDDMVKAGTIQSWEGLPENGGPMDTPYEPIFAAAFMALIRWVRDGIPAPHAPKIATYQTFVPTDKTGCLVANKKDVFGNCKGGIRYPTADCPTAVYQSYTERADGSLQMMFGTAKPFSAVLLKELYGSLEHYRELAAVSAKNAVAKGFVLPEDEAFLVEETVKIAASRGLS